ncbi:sialate O-acetylesterase [uncultured Sunxiuqinia sp.]|uniref:sialate O-acetylesterase n=1 Tax=uncultured Sunxiuqinia sp. TaxID=1573825 RepID=UPI002AA95161|nr:sialate O-acetylesterase [uncultured Sunxiuqinia sp.]
MGVPIGLIESDWGGTRIEAWMDEESLKEVDPNLLSDRNGKLNPNTSTALFNAMIYPMIGITMRGTIWYQGESNRKEPQTYAGLMEQMVKSWRELWGLGDFPFYYCQIAPYKYDNTVNTAYLREAQLEASKRIPNSGMVSLLDVGNKDHIHPGNKRAAGERLAYFALKETYGIEGIACRGPEFQDMTIKGSSVELTFNENLTSYDQELRLFKVAGKDRTFHPAVAEIKGRKVILTSKEVPDPVAVRYAFDNYVDGNLFNLYGLPASSFRTDDW